MDKAQLIRAGLEKVRNAKPGWTGDNSRASRLCRQEWIDSTLLIARLFGEMWLEVGTTGLATWLREVKLSRYVRRDDQGALVCIGRKLEIAKLVLDRRTEWLSWRALCDEITVSGSYYTMPIQKNEPAPPNKGLSVMMHDLEQSLIDLAETVRPRDDPLADALESLAETSKEYVVKEDSGSTEWLRAVLQYISDIEERDSHTLVKSKESGEWYWRGRDIRLNDK